MLTILNFEKVLTFDQKYTIIADPPTTRSGSYVYAACEQTLTNSEKRCTVTLETPAFTNATYKNTCSVNIIADNPNQENLTNLEFYSFNEEVVLVSWLVESDQYDYYGKIRILKMINCEFIDLLIPANHVPHVLLRTESFDVILANETYCGSTQDYLCKITYNTNGKQIHGPIQIIDESNYNNTYRGVNLTQEQAVDLLMDVMCWQTLIIDLNFDGNKTEALWLTNLCNFRISTANHLISVCILMDRTSITCRQYDEGMNMKMEVKFKFDDGQSQRWLQPYNMKNGTMLVVTDVPGDVEGKRYDHFSVVKFYNNEQKSRPLEISGLNFECNPNSLHVVVSEDEVGEICFHFICDRLEQYQAYHIRSTIKFSTKCLPDSF